MHSRPAEENHGAFAAFLQRLSAMSLRGSRYVRDVRAHFASHRQGVVIKSTAASRILVAVATLFLFPLAAQALNFTRLPGPEAPDHSDTVSDGATLYAVAGHLIFKSGNGTSWSAIAGQPPAAANRIAAAGGRLYAMTGNKIFASADEGANWNDITGPLANFQGGVFTGAGSVFVITGKNELVSGITQFIYRVFRGDGQTDTWTSVFSGADSVGSIVQSGSNLCLTNGNGAIKFSTNGGTSWSSAGSLSGQFGVIGVSPDGATVLAASGSNSVSVRKSANNCASFTSLPSGAAPNNASLRALGVDSAGNYYAGFEDGSILKSTNSGTSFVADNSVDLPAKTLVGVFSMTPVGSAMLARTGGGFFNNGSGSWTAASSGINTSFNAGLISRDASADAIGVGAADFWVSDVPASSAFTRRNNGLEVRNISALLRKGSVLLAGTSGFVNFLTNPATSEIGLFRSTDDGATWTRAGTGLPTGAGVESLATDGTAVFAAVNSPTSFQTRGLYKSIDDGVSWAAVSGFTNITIRNLAGRSGELYVYVSNTGIFKSTDGAATPPTAINDGLAGNRSGKVFAYSGGLIASASGIVHRSTDDGANWNPTTGFAVSRFGIELLAMAEDAAGVLYLGDEHAGLSVSSDGGATWVPDSSGLLPAETCIPRIQNLLVKNGKVYLGSGGTGVYSSNVLGGGSAGDSIGCTTNVDTFPNNFFFTTQNNVAPATQIQSNVISVTGLGSSAQANIRVVDGEYSISSINVDTCSGPFTTAPGLVQNGMLVCLRHTSAATGETSRTTTLFIGDAATMGEASGSFTSATGLVFTGRDDEVNTAFGSNGFATNAGIGQADDIKILGDGRIVAAGLTAGPGGFSDSAFGLARYNANGTVDTSFGTNGVASVNPSSGNDLLSAVVPLPGGKFMLVGTIVGSNNLVALARINANGTADSGFGTGGIVTFDVRPAATSNFELVGDATLLGDGTILVAGAITTSGAGTQFIAMKFSQDGVADTSFGGNDPLFADGVASSGAMGTTSISAGAVAVQSTGKFVIAGLRQPSFNTLEGVAVRFNADGSFDTGWGASGVRSIPTATDIKDAVVIAGDKIVLAGRATISNFFRPMVARLNADGTLDTGFAGDGVFSLDSVSGSLTTAEVLTDGDVAAIGQGTAPDGSSQLLYVRLTSAGVLDNSFGPSGQGFLFRRKVNGTTVFGSSSALRADGGVMVGGAFGTPQAVFVFGGQGGTPGDTIPEPFSFTGQTGVDPMSVRTSDSATITGIDAPANVTVSNGQYSVGCGETFISTQSTISSGQGVCVRHTASPAFATEVTTTLTVGGVPATFTSVTRAGNAAPTQFQFVPATNVAASTVVMSNAPTISGNEVPATVHVSGGEYSVGCNSNGFTAVDGPINAGQTVCVRHTSAATPSTQTSTVLTISGVSATFMSTTAAAPVPDTSPDTFTFTDLNDVALSTPLISNSFTVSGINTATPISVANGQYSINSAEFTGADGTVIAGDTVRVSHTSATTPGTAVNTVLTVGDKSDIFTSITASQTPDDITPNAYSFVDRNGVVPNSAITSNTITVSGITAAAPISVTGGQYRIGSGGFTDQPGTVVGGDTVDVRVISGSAGTTVNATLTIGDVFDTFSVTSATQSGGGSVPDAHGRPVSLLSSIGAIGNLQLMAMPANAPAGIQYPNGFFSYNVTGLPLGGTAQVTFTLPAAGANAYVKCAHGTCVRVPDVQLTINGNTLTLAMVDGGPFDEDGVANGTIVDPGAPAIVTTTTTVSSGGGGALGWMPLLPGLFAACARRRIRSRRA